MAVVCVPHPLLLLLSLGYFGGKNKITKPLNGKLKAVRTKGRDHGSVFEGFKMESETYEK